MNNSFATVKIDSFPVTHSVRPDVGREFLSLDVPNGWDDVKKISKRVLTFNGRDFKFTGWNSDTLQCYFARPIGDEFPLSIATLKR